MSTGSGPGTGYEDAILRRISTAESRARELEAALERERAQGKDLAQDNAKLRVRAEQLETRARALSRSTGLAITLLALVVLGIGIYLLTVYWGYAPALRIGETF